MGEIWLMLAAMALCMFGCAAAGYLVARRIGYSPAVVLAGLTAAAMLLFGRYLTDSVWIAQILPPRLLPVFGNWLPLLAGALAGIGWVISRRPAWVKAAVLGALLACSIYLPYRSLFGEHPDVRNVWAGDLCLQTTDATCGAAAAATLLQTAGIPATEHEMVGLCFTTWRGTPLHGMVRGLAIKTAGTPWRVRVSRMSEPSLAALDRPAMLYVGLDADAPPGSRYVQRWGWVPGVAHMVVMTRVWPDGRLSVGDPSTGWEAWQPEALNVLWHGTAIYLEPRNPDASSAPRDLQPPHNPRQPSQPPLWAQR